MSKDAGEYAGIAFLALVIVVVSGVAMMAGLVAMYVAKSARAPFEVYSEEQDTYSTDRLALVAELRRAIDDGELTLFFQPKTMKHGTPRLWTNCSHFLRTSSSFIRKWERTHAV